MKYLYFGKDDIFKIVVLVTIHLQNVVMQLIITDLVPLLKLAILGKILLNSIVGEVNSSVFGGKTVLRGSCAHIALSVPISL
jgi:hypothetical protein